MYRIGALPLTGLILWALADPSGVVATPAYVLKQLPATLSCTGAGGSQQNVPEFTSPAFESAYTTFIKLLQHALPGGESLWVSAGCGGYCRAVWLWDRPGIIAGFKHRGFCGWATLYRELVQILCAIPQRPP